MNILGKQYRTIWEKFDSNDNLIICIIDQKVLPFKFEIIEVDNYFDLINSIKDMTLRGAPLIGAAGAYSLCLALKSIQLGKSSINNLDGIVLEIKSARPTAVNLAWAVDCVYSAIANSNSIDEMFQQALHTTRMIISNEIDACKKIGTYGKDLLLDLYRKKQDEKLNVLTHCNAGWLATIDYGTALSPIYEARDCGINIHVWVDETRPRNQGARLTAFELANEGIEHTIIADNTGGHLMQKGLVDCVIVGTDRTTRNGDVCNKIGIYLKALAAADNNIPFFVAAPTSSIDISIEAGSDVPIECRSSEEISLIEGIDNCGNINSLRIIPLESNALNYGFDITPARLITKIITEHGIINANEIEIMNLLKTR